jgi:hypothetical protein
VRGDLVGKLAVDVGPVDAGLLEQRPAFEDARDAATPAGTLPGVRGEFCPTVGIRERAAQLTLKLGEELRSSIEETIPIRDRHARMLPSRLVASTSFD